MAADPNLRELGLEPAPAAPENERRYTHSRPQTSAVLAILDRHLRRDVHDPDRPVAYNWTIYLDTPSQAFYRQYQSGSGCRLRVRLYASGVAAGTFPIASRTAFFEVKQSSRYARSKLRLPVPTEEVRRWLHTGSVDAPYIDAISAGCPDELRPHLGEGLAPCLVTFYRRTSLSAPTGEARVTLDEGVRFCRPADAIRATLSGWPERIVGRAPTTLLEVKWLGETAPSWLGELSSRLAESAFSKFHCGMQALAGSHA